MSFTHHQIIVGVESNLLLLLFVVHVVMDPVVQHHEVARLDAPQGHDGGHQRAPRSVYRGHQCPRDGGVRILGVIAEA